MPTYVLSTNLYTFAQVEKGFFAWPETDGEAELIRDLEVGDIIIPKFAQSATWASSEGTSPEEAYCEALGLDARELRELYYATVAGGEGAVPYILKVTSAPSPAPAGPEDWIGVLVDKQALENPLSTQEFLRVRSLPPEVAAQFKGAVARGRHLQHVPSDLFRQVRELAASTERIDDLRRYSVIEAASPAEAAAILAAHGPEPRAGDQAMLVGPGGLLGVHEYSGSEFQPIGSPIQLTAEEALGVVADAKTKARESDYFTTRDTEAGLAEIQALLAGPSRIERVDDFARFYNRYFLLERKINQALVIAARVASATSDHVSTDEELEIQTDEAAALHGLTVEDVEQELPDGFDVPRSALAEAVTALRSGKHLLVGGPPGTGKSTLAEALCRAVVGKQYDVATGTADWTTFDTIGGYIPSDEGLRFEPGIVLRALNRGAWLVIDELNRADIDKAFGPMFTLLAGSGEAQARRVVLPYRRNGQNVTIVTSDTAHDSADYSLRSTWRMLGTLNLSDKATLFQMSFAFLRRFAVLNLPLPSEDRYRTLLDGFFPPDVPGRATRAEILDATLRLAFGPRSLGPAITSDMGAFMAQAFATTAAGTLAYEDSIEAFVTAVRLFAVPQYEGATDAEWKAAFRAVRDGWPGLEESDFESLREAFERVALS